MRFWIQTLLLILTSCTLAWGGDGEVLYVANQGSNSISVISIPSNIPIATITQGIGAFPNALALTPNNSTLYVTNRNSNSISVVQTSTNTVTKVIDTAASPAAAIVTKTGSKLYVACETVISVVDTASNTVTTTLPYTVLSFALSLDGSILYAGGIDVVYKIRTSDNSLAGSIAMPTNNAITALALSKDGSVLYAGSDETSAAGNLFIINTLNNTYSTISNTGQIFQLLVTPDGKIVYALSGSASLYIVNTSNNTLVDTFNLGRGMAATLDSSTLYLSEQPADLRSNSIDIMRTSDNVIIGNISNGIGINPGALVIGIPSSPVANLQRAVREYSPWKVQKGSL